MFEPIVFVSVLLKDGATISDIAYEYFGDAFVVRINGGFKDRPRSRRQRI